MHQRIKGKQKRTGFTLVELIVTISILSVLGTIGFLSYQGHTSASRDASRRENLSLIQKWLELTKTKRGSYPLPDSAIDVLASWSVIGYQWTVGKTVSSQIGLSQGTTDPASGYEYTYSSNKSQSKYELFALNETPVSFLPVETAYASGSWSAILLGDPLGILTDTNLVPMERYKLPVDVVLTQTGYIALVKEGVSVSGTGGAIRSVVTGFEPMGTTSFFRSCKEIRDNGFSTGNGPYTINPSLSASGSFLTYCDMATEGGGWTLVFSQPARGEFWNGTTITTNFSGSTSCLGYTDNCVNRSYSTVPATEAVLLDGNEWTPVGSAYASRTIYSNISDFSGKTIHEIFTHTGGTVDANQVAWHARSPKVVKPFANSLSYGYNGYPGMWNLYWDFSNVTVSEITFNDDQPSWWDGLIGGAWVQGCSWPQMPCSPHHWYTNYRLWVR